MHGGGGGGLKAPLGRLFAFRDISSRHIVGCTEAFRPGTERCQSIHGNLRFAYAAAHEIL